MKCEMGENIGLIPIVIVIVIGCNLLPLFLFLARRSVKVTKLLAYALVTGRVILYSNIMNINKLYYNRLYCIKKHNAINFVTL